MTTATIAGKAGDTVCRPTVWTDVVKFFILNYGLHAITVIGEPGDTAWASISAVVLAILFPFSGIQRALGPIYWFPRNEPDDLQTARKAGALCTVVTRGDNIPSNFLVIPKKTNIHGQYSADPMLGHRLLVVKVPRWFTVKPLMSGNESVTRPSLSCNYSVIKAIAAIVQVLYSSLELYEAQGQQFARFGYAAYSLSVIPYIQMSLMNLFASTFAPQYPSAFIVLYRGTERYIPSAENVGGQPKAAFTQQEPQIIERDKAESVVSKWELTETQSGKDLERVPDSLPIDERNQIAELITGAIGEAYGDFNDPTPRPRSFKILVTLAQACLVMALLSTPFVAIKVLTNFEPGQSTRSQRSSMMFWIIAGQFYASWGLQIERNAWQGLGQEKIGYRKFILFLLLPFLLLSISTVSGLITVARMMLDNEICTRI